MANEMPVPPQQPIVTFFNPNRRDLGLVEIWSTERATDEPIDLGTPHPNTRDYPGFRLGLQAAIETEDGWWKRVWVTDETNPDWFNYEIKFQAEGVAFPTYVRQYRVDKKDYSPLAKGTPLGSVYLLKIPTFSTPGSGYTVGTFPNVTFSGGGGSGATGHAIVNLDGTIADVVLDNGGTGYTSAPTAIIDDPPIGLTAIAQAFVQPQSAILVAEQAEEFPKGSEFFGLFLNVTRVYETLPGPELTQTVFERDGVLKTTTRQRVLAGTEITDEVLIPLIVPPPSNILTRHFYEQVDTVVSNQITEVITVDSDSLLDLPSFTVSIENVIPILFRALIPTHIVSHIVEGEAVMPVLGLGEFERSERQLHPLYKEVRYTVLDDLDLPVTFCGVETNDKKQVVTVCLTLELDSVPASLPDEVTDIDYKKLGNGMAVEISRTIPRVFPEDSYTKTVLNLIPEKLRAVVPITETTIDEVGAPDTTPDLLTGELSRTESRLTEFTKRTRITKLGILTVPISVTDYETDKDKQVVTVVYTLLDHGTSVATVTAVQDVNVEDLGNGYDVETVRIVPEVFPANTYSISILDLIPPSLRAAVPMYESDVTSAGTADTTPTLATGELSHAETQVTEFTKRIRTTSLGPISPPVTVTELQTDKDKQIVTILHTLRLTGTGVAVPTALIDVDTIELGNGYDVETTRTISAVFPAYTYSKSILDLIPPSLRANVPMYESDVTSAGVADTTPDLLTGELSRSETQVTLFTKRVRVTSLGGIVSASITNSELVEDYGGGIAETVITLSNSIGTIDEGLTVLESRLIELGNGYFIKQTKQLVDATWPILESRLWDENMRLEYNETKQVVDAGDAEDADPGGVFAWVSEVKGIDKWRSLKTNTSKAAPDYVDESSALITYQYKPYRFPGLLYYANGYYVRSADATLVQHKIKTWWLKSGTTPTVGETGGGFDVEIDEIILDDVVINNLSNTGLTYSGPVLHDDLQIGTLTYPATTPSYTEYALGEITGTPVLHNIASLYSPGSAGGYIVGDTVTIASGGYTMSVDVTFVYDVPSGPTGLIGATTTDDPSGTYPPGTYGPIAASGGSGTGAYFNVWAAETPSYTPGTGWIGTLRVIGASVTTEKEKDIWKIQTESVIMR